MVVCRQQPEMWRKHFLQDLELSFSLASETEMVVVVVPEGGVFFVVVVAIGWVSLGDGNTEPGVEHGSTGV